MLGRGRRPLREPSLTFEVILDNNSPLPKPMCDILPPLNTKSHPRAQSERQNTIDFPAPPKQTWNARKVSYAYITDAGMLAEFMLPEGAQLGNLPIEQMAQVSSYHRLRLEASNHIVVASLRFVRPFGVDMQAQCVWPRWSLRSMR